MSTGENIQNFRKEKGLTQAQLADKADISRVTLGAYERNERIPNIEITNKIAQALNVSVDEIMGNDPLEVKSPLHDFIEKYQDEFYEELRHELRLHKNRFTKYPINYSIAESKSKYLSELEKESAIKEDHLNKHVYIKEITENLESLDLESIKIIDALIVKLKNDK